MKTFAERLKKLRETKKIQNPQFTQGHVAEILGVARTTYTAYENGTKQPPMETVIKLAKLFDTTVDFLYGLADEPSPVKSSASDENKNNYLTEDEKEMLEFFKNPELNLFFKEMKQAPEAQLEEMRQIWEVIKRRGMNK